MAEDKAAETALRGWLPAPGWGLGLRAILSTLLTAPACDPLPGVQARAARARVPESRTRPCCGLLHESSTASFLCDQIHTHTHTEREREREGQPSELRKVSTGTGEGRPISPPLLGASARPQRGRRGPPSPSRGSSPRAQTRGPGCRKSLAPAACSRLTKARTPFLGASSTEPAHAPRQRLVDVAATAAAGAGLRRALPSRAPAQRRLPPGRGDRFQKSTSVSSKKYPVPVGPCGSRRSRTHDGGSVADGLSAWRWRQAPCGQTLCWDASASQSPRAASARPPPWRRIPAPGRRRVRPGALPWNHPPLPLTAAKAHQSAQSGRGLSPARKAGGAEAGSPADEGCDRHQRKPLRPSLPWPPKSLPPRLPSPGLGAMEPKNARHVAGC